jgi:hypothetical protein
MGQWGGRPLSAVTAPNRMSMVKTFDLNEVEAVLQLKNLQKPVVSALLRQRNQLTKEKS